MHSIKGKREGLMRILGTVLILFGLIASIISDFFILLSSTTLYILTLLIFIPWFILIVLLKLEKDFFVENMLKLFFILAIYSVTIIIIGSVISSSETITLLFVVLTISNILIIFCWHFALSIYKKEKLIFLLGGIGYCILMVIFGIGYLIAYFGWFLGLSPLLSVILGICAIIIAEIIMKKKGLLNYI